MSVFDFSSLLVTIFLFSYSTSILVLTVESSEILTGIESSASFLKPYNDRYGVLHFLITQSSKHSRPSSRVQFNSSSKTIYMFHSTRSGQSIYDKIQSKLNSSPNWSGRANIVKKKLEDAQLDFDGAYRKAYRLKSCEESIRKARRHVSFAISSLSKTNPDFLTASVRVSWSLSALIPCMADVEDNSRSAEYFGEAELQAGKRRLLISHQELVQLLEASGNVLLRPGAPLSDNAVAILGEGVDSTSNNFFITLEGNPLQGSRVRSSTRYNFGIFSAKIKCPSGVNSSQINTAFFLASDFSHKERSSIIMEFHGASHQFVSLGITNRGIMGPTTVVNMGYDCSSDFHTYSIAWSPKKITWSNERGTLRVIDNTWWDEIVASGPMYLYMEMALRSSVDVHGWPTHLPLENNAVDYMASFTGVKVKSPIKDSDVPALPPTAPYAPLFPFSMDYCTDHMKIGQNKISIQFNESGCGGRFSTTTNFRYGQFSARIKCPPGNTSGLVTSFYLSTMEGSPTRDEIDFEFLGNNKRIVQTNVFVRGIGNREKIIQLGFDCSTDFHTYTIRYTPRAIVWFVDGEMKRQYFSRNPRKYPRSPVFVYGSVWNASSVLDGSWAGAWRGRGMPFSAEYRDFVIESPWLGSA